MALCHGFNRTPQMLNIKNMTKGNKKHPLKYVNFNAATASLSVEELPNNKKLKLVTGINVAMIVRQGSKCL